MIVTVGLTLFFGKSDNLAAAYGIAVSATPFRQQYKGTDSAFLTHDLHTRKNEVKFVFDVQPRSANIAARTRVIDSDAAAVIKTAKVAAQDADSKCNIGVEPAMRKFEQPPGGVIKTAHGGPDMRKPIVQPLDQTSESALVTNVVIGENLELGVNGVVADHLALNWSFAANASLW